ncbi:Pr6Pr family membrane protein [Saccharopolyspora spinosporotrichia]
MGAGGAGTGFPGAVTGWHASRCWHALLAAVVALALVVQVVVVLTSGADASGRVDPGLGPAARLGRLFCFFTIQSNILVLATSVSLALDPERDGALWRVLRLDGLLGILIAGVVFTTVLARLLHLTGPAYWATVGFRYVAPWMALAGWLLFGPRPRIDWSTVVIAFGWPGLWIGGTFLHGALSGWYPYPFLDPRRVGYPAAVGNTALVLGLAALAAVALKLLDQRLPRTAGPPAAGGPDR